MKLPRVPAEHTVGPQLMQLPPLFLCCCFPIAWLPQLVSSGSRTGLQGVETAPAQRWSRSRAWARASGSGPGDSCDYKAAEAAEAGGGPGSGRYFGPGLLPPLLFLLGAWGEGPWVLFLGSPPSSLFASFSLCPEGWEQRARWRLLGGPGSNGGQGGACPTSLSPAFWRPGVLLLAPLRI